MLDVPQTKLQDGMWKKSVQALRPSGSASGLSRSKNVDFMITPQMNGSLLCTEKKERKGKKEKSYIGDVKKRHTKVK
jgi:hypothetical protein